MVIYVNKIKILSVFVFIKNEKNEFKNVFSFYFLNCRWEFKEGSKFFNLKIYFIYIYGNS